MPFKGKREKLVLTSEEIEKLTEIICSRTQPVRSVERAKILLASYEGKSDSQIARDLSGKGDITDEELDANRQRVIRCINKAPDLMPIPDRYPTISRDYKYVRHGTLSLLVGIDLLTGEIHHKVFDNHRS